MFLVRLLPRRLALAIGAQAGSFVYDLLASEREKVLAHLELAFGKDKTDPQIRSIARQVFVNCAKSGVDWILYPRFNRSNWDHWVYCGDGLSKVDQVLARGKGLIMVTGHFGNWEILASTFTVRGYTGCVIGRRIYYEPYNRLIVKTRLSKGVRTLYRDESPKEILKALKANQIVGIVADQDVEAIESIFIPFFGELAYTPVGPAKLSLSTGAPIVPGFIVRNRDNSYQLIVEDPIIPDPEAPRTEEIERITRLWSASIENRVRQAPEQWVWMHRRWKTRPEVLIERK